jgi:hypothetical protein
MKFKLSRIFRLITGNLFNENQLGISDLLSGLEINQFSLSFSLSGRKRKRQINISLI